MEREQEEIQSIGFFGIYQEALKLTTSYRKVFSQITLSVILPLSFMFLALIEITDILSLEITHNSYVLATAQVGSPKYSKTSEIISHESTEYLLFHIASLILALILSLLSTSTVAYTVACIYTASKITYKTVIKVVPNVWKRLLITFIWKCVIFFAINMGVLLVVLLGAVTLGPSVTRITLAIILLVIYLFGILYLSFVWQLANVISVLEDVCEYQALVKSKNLIKGKTRICAAIYLINILCSLGIYLGFIASAVGVDSVWGKLLHLCVWSMIISVLYLFGLVIQTIIYFICKSYHHENIDKSSLANLLEVYRKDYVPLDTKEVHMQHSMV